MDGSVGQETVVLGQKAVQAGDENLATGFWGRKLGSALGQEQGFWGKLGSKGRVGGVRVESRDRTGNEVPWTIFKGQGNF